MKNAELNPDLTAASASASAQKDKSKSDYASEDEFDETFEIKKKHKCHDKTLQKDSSSSSASASSSVPDFFTDPVARVRAVERRTWTRMVLLFLTFVTLFIAVHPTAFYRMALKAGYCVDFTTPAGHKTTICPPQTFQNHPLL